MRKKWVAEEQTNTLIDRKTESCKKTEEDND